MRIPYCTEYKYRKLENETPESFAKYKSIPFAIKEPEEVEPFPYAYRCRVQFPGFISYHKIKHCEHCEPVTGK